MKKRSLNYMIQPFSPEQRELIKHAENHKDEVVKKSLNVLKGVAKDPKGHPYRAFLPDSLLLLAWAEAKEAHPLIMKLMKLPEALVEELLGLTMPNQLPAFLYKTCGYNINALKKLVKDSNAYIYCRTAAMQALVYAAQDEIAEKKAVLSFFLSLYTGKEANNAETGFWDDLTDSCFALQPNPTQLEVVRSAVKRGLTDPQYVDQGFAPMLI